MVHAWELLGINVQSEVCATTFLNLLDLAGIPSRTSDRADGDTIVIGGGSVALEPEPLAPFFDAFALGEGEEVIDRIRELAPEVVLMDVKMPKLDGVESIRQMRKLGLDTPVILLSAYSDEEYVVEGLRAGARGYLLKDVDRDELVLAIRTVREGGTTLQPMVVQRLIDTLGGQSGKALTKREREVLALLRSSARNQEIANRLSLSVKTIKFHLENIYGKLGVQNRIQALGFARERGLLDN